MRSTAASHGRWTLYWGARNRGGLYLPDLPAAWAAEHEHIRYVPVLSDATAQDAWSGRRGLVHRAVLEDHADLSAFQVYACGAPAMIDAARAEFVAHGACRPTSSSPMPLPSCPRRSQPGPYPRMRPQQMNSRHDHPPPVSAGLRPAQCQPLLPQARVVPAHGGPALPQPLHAGIAQDPKGKLPWIDDDGTAVADSGLIIDYLKRKYGDPLDAGLDPNRQRALALAITRLIEEHLYWTVLYDRWIAPQGWEMTRAGFFGTLPWPLRMIVPLGRTTWHSRRIAGTWHGPPCTRTDSRPGHGRRRRAGEPARTSRIISSAPRPTSVDAIATAFLANILMVPLETPIKAAAAGHANLVAYCRRMARQYFPADYSPR
jgi:hypothetical protein